MRIGDVFASLPGLPLLILINAALSPKINELSLWVDNNTFIDGFQDSGAASYITIFFALSLFSWVGSARLIRSQVLAIRERDYITAARSIGLRPRRIIFKHLLPNISNLLILLISGSLGTMVGLYETAVDYLTGLDKDGKTIRPKVIASTATTRGTREQMKKIFNRKGGTAEFPPPAFDRKDSFFWWETNVTGRLHVGVSFSHKSGKFALGKQAPSKNPIGRRIFWVRKIRQNPKIRNEFN